VLALHQVMVQKALNRAVMTYKLARRALRWSSRLKLAPGSHEYVPPGFTNMER